MTDFQDRLKKLMANYVNFVYRVTVNFPKEELYGSVSQWRRSTLSIILTHIEGYARRRPAVQLNFYETSYASLQESKYLLDFSHKQQFIKLTDYEIGKSLADEIGAMLWKELTDLEKSIKLKK